jgi:disulfide bond formation protein DsbB
MSWRLLNVGVALASIGLIVFAIVYLQNVLGLPPCPLCILQRIGFMGVAAVLIIAALHGPGPVGLARYGVLLMAVAGLGGGVAVRHLWLQFFPTPGVASCGPGLNFMLNYFSLGDTFAMVFQGTGDCGVQHWSFLGLNIPAWSLVWFVVFALYGFMLWRAQRP